MRPYAFSVIAACLVSSMTAPTAQALVAEAPEPLKASPQWPDGGSDDAGLVRLGLQPDDDGPTFEMRFVSCPTQHRCVFDDAVLTVDDGAPTDAAAVPAGERLAAESTEASADVGAAGAPRRWYWDPVRDAVVHAVVDTGRVLSEPVRWDGRDWAIAGLAGGAVVGSILVLDDPVQRYSQAHRNRGTDRIARYANPFGTIYSFGVLGAFGVVGVATGDRRAESVLVDGLEATIIASGLITPTIKYAAGRSRPNADQGTHRFRPFSSAASFPSGHATQAFAVASVVATVYDEQAWVAPIAFIGAGLVGFARINDNKHFLSDVLAGGLIGGGVGYEVVHLDRLRSGRSGVAITPIIGAAGEGVAMRWDF